jgi:8-oxo-dGTP diphosphatase
LFEHAGGLRQLLDVSPEGEASCFITAEGRNKQMLTSIRVVAAVVERDGKYLITQRRPDAVLPLLWEFPGGRVEEGEGDSEALCRELDERLGVEIEVGQHLATSVHDYEGYSVTLVVYKAVLQSEQIQLRRVNDFRWVLSTEFENYTFPPADQATMDQLLGFPGKSS